MAVVGLTCGEICRVFCCPPCPSAIAAKLAFIPPEPTTYTISRDEDDKENLHLTERAEFLFTNRELSTIEAMKVRTSRRNMIACMYVKLTDTPKYTLLFSHGNAVDLGQMSSYYVGLGTRLGCNVFGYDYSGYGDSTGSPSEANIYADAEAAWNTMVDRLGIDPSKIIIYGQSIGSVASVDLATRHPCAGVVLHSPLLSGMRVAFPDVQRSYFFDPFPSIRKITRVQSVVLVIHGTEDEVIDFSHGLALFERAPLTVDPLWVEGAGHNDIERFSSYLLRLLKFVNKELPSREAAQAEKAATEAATAAAVAAVSNGVGTNRSAVGADGVMALARMDDDDDDDDNGDTATGSSEGRDEIAAISTTTTTAAVTDTAAGDGSSTHDDVNCELTSSSTDRLMADVSTPEVAKRSTAGSPQRTLSSSDNKPDGNNTLDVSTSTGTVTSAVTIAKVLSASEQSLPLSTDCADRAPSASPEPPSVTAALDVAMGATPAVDDVIITTATKVEPVDGRNLVYV
ncbi:alpha/beta hydrolase domain-containing protein 17C-like [Sycon ciliatum]|uniref:alpha/beta hydrolase domain-containing protein 17C-like n=1 Tax=Sycon ciliatum TaxID=27933 RepID=UPI0031F6A7D4